MVLEQLITNVKIKPLSLTHTIYKNVLKMDPESKLMVTKRECRGREE